MRDAETLMKRIPVWGNNATLMRFLGEKYGLNQADIDVAIECQAGLDWLMTITSAREIKEVERLDGAEWQALLDQIRKRHRIVWGQVSVLSLRG